MSERSAEQPRPHWLVRLAVWVAPVYRWFLVWFALMTVLRWFDGRSDTWEVLFLLYCCSMGFWYFTNARKLHGLEKAAAGQQADVGA